MDLSEERLATRGDMAVDSLWRLEDMYETESLWEEDFQRVKEGLSLAAFYQGKLDTAGNLSSFLQKADELKCKMDRVLAYAWMKKDEDNTNSLYQGLADRAQSLLVQLDTSLSFFEPELLQLPSNQVSTWIEETPELAVYRHFLLNILRKAPHTLTQAEERLLALAGEVTQAPSTIYRMFNDADLTFPDIVDEKGNVVELTHGKYIQFLMNQDQGVRKRAFQAVYATYGKWKNTLSSTYSSAVKQSLFYAKARNFHSSLEASLNEDKVPVSVYTNLIQTVTDHLPLFHRYMDVRKRALALDELHLYDVYVPMVKDIDMKIEPKEAISMVTEGLTPLGTTYQKALTTGFQSRWIDWYENKGKTSGAYSWGAYGVHPYVLMNYQPSLDTMFTLAHEMGHALHSFYADEAQAYVNAGYSIFLAEVASTLNECLVMASLLEKTTHIPTKKYLINYYLEQFKGTVFRQTMFAEFEMIVHQEMNNGIAHTTESLCALYKGLNDKYFGPSVVVDEEIALEWMRIPHFYSPFYVYKYATGFSAAVSLAKQILTEKEVAVERYLEFLRGGGSDYPLNLLKKAGVDMTSPAPIKDAMDVFASLIKSMEELE